MDFCGLNLVSEGLESVKDEESEGLEVYLWVLGVFEVERKFRQSNDAKIGCEKWGTRTHIYSQHLHRGHDGIHRATMPQR
jgi:hypothetical protein